MKRDGLPSALSKNNFSNMLKDGDSTVDASFTRATPGNGIVVPNSFERQKFSIDPLAANHSNSRDNA